MSAGKETLPVDALGETFAHRAAGRLTDDERPVELPRYTLLKAIGSGGFGQVYAAHDPVLDRKVAIKLLRRVAPASADPNAGDSERARNQQRARRKLLREAHALAKLGHPNIVAVYDAGTYGHKDEAGALVGDGVFIVMELIDGLTVDRWVCAQQREWKDILAVFRAAGEGLVAAHAKGFAHRDFKPGNVMVNREGVTKVLDFGLASAQLRSEKTGVMEPVDAPLDSLALANESMSMSQTGKLTGTPAYMAPEQFLGWATGPHSDQFSFCLALYEALLGRSPFPGASSIERISAMLRSQYAEPPADSQIPPRVVESLRRGLSFRYQDRFPSMSALLDALDLGADGSTGVSAATIPNRSFHEHNTSRAEQRAIRDCIQWMEPGVILYWEVPTPTIYTAAQMRSQLDELVRSVERYAMVVDLRRAYLPSQHVMEVIRGLFMDPHLQHVAVASPDPVTRFGASFVLEPVRPPGTWSAHDTRADALERARVTLQQV